MWEKRFHKFSLTHCKWLIYKCYFEGWSINLKDLIWDPRQKKLDQDIPSHVSISCWVTWKYLITAPVQDFLSGVQCCNLSLFSHYPHHLLKDVITILKQDQKNYHSNESATCFHILLYVPCQQIRQPCLCFQPYACVPTHTDAHTHTSTYPFYIQYWKICQCQHSPMGGLLN